MMASGFATELLHAVRVTFSLTLCVASPVNTEKSESPELIIVLTETSPVKTAFPDPSDHSDESFGVDKLAFLMGDVFPTEDQRLGGLMDEGAADIVPSNGLWDAFKNATKKGLVAAIQSLIEDLLPALSGKKVGSITESISPAMVKETEIKPSEAQ